MSPWVLRSVTRMLPLPGRYVRALIRRLEPCTAPLDRPAIVTPWLGRFRVELTDLRETQQKDIFFRGCYELRESLLFGRLLGPGAVVVDVGANIGWYTLRAARLVGPTGRVYAFEPSARLFARLRRMIALNRLAHVSPVGLALSDRAGEAVLAGARADHQGLGSIIPGVAPDAAGGETVGTTTFDEFHRAHGSPRIRLMKIDVEGAELKVLEGARDALARHLIDRLIVEVDDGKLRLSGHQAGDVLELLRSCGYRWFRIGILGCRALERGETVTYANLLACA